MSGQRHFDLVGSVPEQELRVASTTSVQLLATSIVRNVEEGKKVALSCIGVQPLSQAVKAIAVANGQAAPQGFMFSLLPSFHVMTFLDKVTQEPVERTSIRFTVLCHKIGG